MTDKHSSPDELAEAPHLYDSPGMKESEDDAPALVKLPKRRMSGSKSQNEQAPSEKKPKFAGPSNIIASTAHEDKNTQKATPHHPQNVQSKPLPKNDAPPPALSSPYGSGHTDSTAAAEPPQNAQYENWTEGQTQQNAPPAGPPPPVLDPTDDELYILVNYLESCLVTSEQGMTDEKYRVLGNYLVRRNVLARLAQRGDYLAITNNKELAPKLARILHTVLQKVIGCVFKENDEDR
ncbi:coatomer subunit alpha [Physcia stellaris]|nr:coatomer subunit alpha [Physcia stellaris]